MKPLLVILLLILFDSKVGACIWDADSMFREKLRSHDLAKTILAPQPDSEDREKLQQRIKELQTTRKENDVNWWNNLAGAYIRLGQPDAAVKLLVPVIGKFPNDYGMHANLGTAYHLLRRYAEAEKEIARDLEINPEAHFGLEKYHLALLQYLVRDSKYRARHLYVDELTRAFLSASSRLRYSASAQPRYDSLTNAEANLAAFSTNRNDPSYAKFFGDVLGGLGTLDDPPPYRAKWNLATDTNFEAGVIYMAQMNPMEPACMTMLGVAAWRKHEYHLAETAFKKAIALGSPQAQLLQFKITGLEDYIRESPFLSLEAIFYGTLAVISVLIAHFICGKIRNWRRI